MSDHDDQQLTRLLRRAHLFDDPAAYAAGVRDALELVAGPDALDALDGSVRRGSAREGAGRTVRLAGSR